MKSKIKEALKTEYVNLGLSEEAFVGVANLLSKTITEESQIPDAVSQSEVKSLLTSIQSSTDKLRRENAEYKKKLEGKDPVDPKDPKDPADPQNPQVLKIDEAFKTEISALFEGIIAPIRKELDGFKAEKTTKTKISEALALRETLKLDSKQQSWIDDAWTSATSSIGENDTSQNIIDRFKGRYDEYMSRLGSNGYIPATGGGGSEASSAQKTIEKIKEKQKQESAPDLAKRFGIAEKTNV